jgi:hypothetical protein
MVLPGRSYRLLVVPIGAVGLALLIMAFGLWTIPVVAVVIIGIVALWRIDVALYALVFLLPFTAIEGMASGYNQIVQAFKRVLIVEIAAIWMLHTLLARAPVYLPRRVLIPMVLFAAASLASILRAPEPQVALTSTARLLSYCLVYVIMTMNIVRLPQDVWRAVRVLFLAAILTSLFGLYQLVAHFVGWRTLLNPSYEVVYLIPRVHSFMTEPLHLANFLLLVCPMGLALYSWRTGTWKIVSGLAGALSLTGIVLAASRAGWGVLALVAVLFLVLAGRYLKLSRLAFIAGLVVATAIPTVSLIWARQFGSGAELLDYVTRFATFAEASSGEGDLRGRLQNLSLWRQAIVTSPVIGIGTNNVGFRFYDDMTIGEPKISSSGNTYLDTFIETGGLGAIGFVALLVVALSTSWSRFRLHGSTREGALFLGLFLGTLGMAVHINFYGSLTWAAHGFFAMGLSFAADRALAPPPDS